MDKTSKYGRPYQIENGRRLVWRPEDDDGEQGEVTVTIPLRLKLGVVLDVADLEQTAAGMATLLERVIPGQMDAVRDMDVNDFQDMFGTWQAEYNALNGASLGEPSASA